MSHEQDDLPSTPLLVVGLGGLGGVIAGALAEAGRPVQAWARRPAVRDVVRRDGLLLQDGSGARRVRVAVVDEPPAGAYAHVLLVTPPGELDAAARHAGPWLAPGGVLVPLANGLPEERLAPAVGAARLIGAVVDLSASSPSPGVAVRATRGRIVVGRLDGPPDAATERLARLLEAVAPVHVTANLRGARWAKLAVNACVSSMATAAGGPFGPLLRHASLRRLALQVLGEVAAVARAEGVRLEATGGLRADRLGIPPGLLPSRAGLVARHLALIASARGYRRSRSSMLAQLQRGLVPPVEFLNGEVVARAAAHGIPAPANAALVAGILAIARGERTSSRATLERLAAEARREAYGPATR